MASYCVPSKRWVKTGLVSQTVAQYLPGLWQCLVFDGYLSARVDI